MKVRREVWAGDTNSGVTVCVCVVKGDGITQRDNVAGEEIKTEAGATKTTKARGKLKRTTVTKGGECAKDRAMKETWDLPQRGMCSIS